MELILKKLRETLMDNWIAILLVVIAIIIIVGNLSTFHKSSHQKMRKKSLNDLEETLPRTNKTEHKMSPINSNKSK